MFVQVNRVFRVMTLVIFALELLAPVFLGSTSGKGSAADATKVSHAVFPQDLIAPLLLEELNENEEEKDDHATTYLPNCCTFNELRHMAFDLHQMDVSSFTFAMQQVSLSPALFRVHCTLRI